MNEESTKQALCHIKVCPVVLLGTLLGYQHIDGKIFMKGDQIEEIQWIFMKPEGYIKIPTNMRHTNANIMSLIVNTHNTETINHNIHANTHHIRPRSIGAINNSDKHS